MSAKRWFRHLYLCYFSQPAAERTLYRECRRKAPKSIVEIGVGKGERAGRLLELVLEVHPAAEVRYVGIDLFEARPAESPGLALKQAHGLFKPLGVKLQLVPGDPYSALSRTANGVRDIDWLIVSHDVDAESLARAWMFVPRMTGERTRIFVEQPAENGRGTRYQELLPAELRLLAAPKSNRKAA